MHLCAEGLSVSQIGMVPQVCVPRGLAPRCLQMGIPLPQEVQQARGLREISQGPTKALGASLHLSLCWQERSDVEGPASRCGWGRRGV